MAAPGTPLRRRAANPFASLPTPLQRSLRALGLPVGSVVLALLVGAVIVTVTGDNPFTAYGDLLCGSFGVGCSGTVSAPLQISDTLTYAIPYIFTGLSVAIAFRAGLFNIGAEGQLIAGAIATTIVGIHFATLPAVILLPLVVLAGMAAGMLWGGIVGVLKAYTGAHEVVTTMMLNYVAIFIGQYLVVGGPLQSPHASSQSVAIGSGADLPPLLPQQGMIFGEPGAVYTIHTGIFLALVAAVVYWAVLRRTPLGYNIRAIGQSQRAARYAGISAKRTIVLTMLLAGAFGGLAGAMQIAGLFPHNLTDAYANDTTGFDAIAVALLGQSTAIGVVLSAVFFAALHVGGQFMQLDAGIPSSLIEVLQAVVLFSVAANFLRAIPLRLPALRKATPAQQPVEPGPAALATDIEPSAAANLRDPLSAAREEAP